MFVCIRKKLVHAEVRIMCALGHHLGYYWNVFSVKGRLWYCIAPSNINEHLRRSQNIFIFFFFLNKF